MTAVKHSALRGGESASRPSLDDLRRTGAEARKLIVRAIHHAGGARIGLALADSRTIDGCHDDRS